MKKIYEIAGEQQYKNGEECGFFGYVEVENIVYEKVDTLDKGKVQYFSGIIRQKLNGEYFNRIALGQIERFEDSKVVTIYSLVNDEQERPIRMIFEGQSENARKLQGGVSGFLLSCGWSVSIPAHITKFAAVLGKDNLIKAEEFIKAGKQENAELPKNMREILRMYNYDKSQIEKAYVPITV